MAVPCPDTVLASISQPINFDGLQALLSFSLKGLHAIFQASLVDSRLLAG